MIRIEIQCPYCNKIHVHNVSVGVEEKEKVEDKKSGNDGESKGLD